MSNMDAVFHSKDPLHGGCTRSSNPSPERLFSATIDPLLAKNNGKQNVSVFPNRFYHRFSSRRGDTKGHTQSFWNKKYDKLICKLERCGKLHTLSLSLALSLLTCQCNGHRCNLWATKKGFSGFHNLHKTAESELHTSIIYSHLNINIFTHAIHLLILITIHVHINNDMRVSKTSSQTTLYSRNETCCLCYRNSE